MNYLFDTSKNTWWIRTKALLTPITFDSDVTTTMTAVHGTGSQVRGRPRLCSVGQRCRSSWRGATTSACCRSRTWPRLPRDGREPRCGVRVATRPLLLRGPPLLPPFWPRRQVQARPAEGTAKSGEATTQSGGAKEGSGLITRPPPRRQRW